MTSTPVASAFRSTFVGDSIPEFLSTGSNQIFLNSDSLILNGRILVREKDYKYDKNRGGFELSMTEFSNSDTLVFSYREAPGWLLKSFGTPIPEIAPYMVTNTTSTQPIVPQSLNTPSFSEIRISGAKTFRVTTQSVGTSVFGQSLDLNIEGKLTEDLKISGSISDRGFNPSYGTSNSRLEELDKVNLKLESNNFNAQVGDIV
ncbi:MAG: hypothetical protein ACREBV_10635, partial [Candidatus Zixiibacteriota bacterium]